MAARIRQAERKDYPLIRDFLRDNWSENHVFVTNRQLFDWQHLETKLDRINYLLFEVDYQIQALIGYIPYRHFSASNPTNRIFLAIWKVADNCKIPAAGLHLFRQVKELTGADFIGAIGISDQALPIYQRLGYKTGRMDHFVIFNSEIPGYIALGAPENMNYSDASPPEKLDFVSDKNLIEAICRKSNSPKNSEYLINRYSKHPSFVYTPYLYFQQEKQCVVITREIEVGPNKICRIIDGVGDISILAEAASSFNQLAKISRYEYVDLYVTGLDPDEMKSNGYFVREEYSQTIVPNYFEPFEQKNVELVFAWNEFGKNSQVTLFRGDSDQDRPNA